MRGKQWRIQDLQEGVRQLPGGGGVSPIYYLTNFSQNLHENEEILAERGARVPGTPLDLPLD